MATPTKPSKPTLILSIQSFCVHSTVGQKAAVFPLNALGHEVDVINTVHFSNHKGYAHGATGSSLSASELELIVSGLERNDILGTYTHVLTGYVGSVELLKAVVANVLDKLDPNVIFVCDPVLGDHGKFYVPPELAEIYIKNVIPRATVLTPNQFEAEVLTGIKITSLQDAYEACDRLHAKGVPIVIITSCTLTTSPPNHATLVASTWIPKSSSSSSSPSSSSSSDSTTKPTTPVLVKRLRSDVDSSFPVTNDSFDQWKAAGHEHKRFALDFLLIDGRFSGTGDLMAALLLGWLISHPNDFIGAVEKVCWTVRAVIERTKQATERGMNPFGELKLISAIDEIRNPQRLGPAREIVE